MAPRKVPTGGNSGGSEGSYDIGYKRPPRHTRFRKGVSGNPKGSKKRTVNLATAVRTAATEKIVITAGGEHRTVSAIEATILKLRSDALSGKPNAILAFLGLINQHCPDLVAEQMKRSTPESDRKLVADYFERLQPKSASPDVGHGSDRSAGPENKGGEQ
jgi:hypothetical protein